MAILHLVEAKELQKQGKRLGRAGMSQFIIQCVEEFNKEPSYFNAIRLAGQLHAVSIASKANGYWHEKMREGYNKAYYSIPKFIPQELETENG